MRIVGIDEAGRGSWAGPVVAAAVVLHRPIAGITDSKLLSKQKRQNLATAIKQAALSYGVGWASNEEIDNLGLTAAVAKAMHDAVSELNCAFDKIIIDGNYNFLPSFANVVTKVKADITVAEVSAASILAKVERDNFMHEQAKIYKHYTFDKHVGYGTAAHRKEIRAYGICHIHRKSYKPIGLALESSHV